MNTELNGKINALYFNNVIDLMRLSTEGMAYLMSL